MIGSTVPELELASPDNEIYHINYLLRGAEALVLIFCPFTFGDSKPKTMTHLLSQINSSMETFNSRDVRVACITREPPSTNRHWLNESEFKFEVLSDPTLSVSTALIGTMDLAAYLQSTKGIQTSSYAIPKPGLVVIGGEGTILAKYVAESPDAVTITTQEILKMTGLS